MSEDLEAWARRTLANAVGLPPLRLRHTAGVARRAGWAAAALLAQDEAVVVRSAAWLHDIGYSPVLVKTGCHPIDGARQLRLLGAPDDIVGLVAYHSGAEYEAAERGLRGELAGFPRPPEAVLDVLTYVDMTTDENGHGVSVETRLHGVFERYADGDPVYVAVDVARTYLMAVVRRVQDRLPTGGHVEALDRNRGRADARANTAPNADPQEWNLCAGPGAAVWRRA